MNYDKLTKNSGITKSAKKQVEASGLKIRSDMEIEQLTDEIVGVPTTLSKRQTRKCHKFYRNMDAKDRVIMNLDFTIWFMQSHDIRTLPDDPSDDEYVGQLYYTYFLNRVFPKNKIFAEGLDMVFDPKYRKELTPLKYQSADLLEVA